MRALATFGSLLLIVSSARADRPVLSGPEVVHATADGWFLIHYTLEGADALVDAADADPQNGVPDFLDDVERGLLRVMDVYVAEDGWPAPPPDEGLGGDDRMDVYLRALDARGYAHAEILPSGAIASWVELDPGNAGLGRTVAASIAAHELHHVLEFAVTTGLESWIAEAAASYAQYTLFAEGDQYLDLGREALWQIRLGGPERALDDEGGQFEYAGMVWVKFLIDHAGGRRGALLDLWQAMGVAGGWAAGHEAALPALGLPALTDAAARFAEWNVFACDEDDGRHYDPDSAPCRLGARVAAAGVAELPASGTRGGIAPLGSAYVEFVPDCATADLEVVVRAGAAPLRVQLIEVAAGDEASPVGAADVAAGGEVTLAASDWGWRRRVVVAATNTGAAAGATYDFAATASGTYVGPATLPPVAALAVAPGEPLALDVGGVAELTAAASYGTCADGRDVTAEVTWRSSDDSVATVAAGAVSAVGPGTAELWAEVDGVESNRVGVTVSDAAGCGCRAAAPSGGSAAGGVVLLLLVGLVSRRR